MSIVNSGHLYYSATYDVTHSLQYNYLLSTEQPVQSIIDDRYFFNKFLSVPILGTPRAAGLPWVLKTILGFAGEVHIDLPIPPDDIDQDATTRTYTVTLLSRTNRRRMGTRYARRGLDTDGNAANNVEMEQIVFEDDIEGNQTISSFVQHRGSAPGLWGQELDLSYTPKLIIGDIHKPHVWEAVRKHFEDYRWQYTPEKVVPSSLRTDGKVVCINLLDDRGFEGELTKMYEESVQRFENHRLMYEEFPINKWCKKVCHLAAAYAPLSFSITATCFTDEFSEHGHTDRSRSRSPHQQRLLPSGRRCAFLLVVRHPPRFPPTNGTSTGVVSR